MKQQIKHFSHNDLDGYSPRIILEKTFPNAKISSIFCGYDAIDGAIVDYLSKKEDLSIDIYITDIGIQESTAELLDKRYKEGQNIILLDDHEVNSYLNKYEWVQVKHLYEDGTKTCGTTMLVDYLKDKGYLLTDKTLESYAEGVRRYDTWDWQELNDLKSKNINDLFYMLSRSDFLRFVEEGLTISEDAFEIPEKYQFILDIEQKRIDSYILSKDSTLKEKEIEGYKVGIVYGESYHSELGNALSKSHPKLDLIVIINLSESKLSFRTVKDDIDVCEFAKLFGGGHPKASGATLTPENFDTFVYL